MNCIDFRVADSRVSGPTTPTLNRHSFVDASEPFSRQPRFPSGSFSDLVTTEANEDFGLMRFILQRVLILLISYLRILSVKDRFPVVLLR